MAVAAPSNTACDAIMEKIVAPWKREGGLDAGRDDCKIVRFVTMQGTLLASDIRADVDGSGFDVATEGLDQMALTLRNQSKTEGRFAGYALHEHKKRFAKDRLSSPAETADMRAHCSVWLDGLELAVRGDLFGDELIRFQADIYIYI